MTLQELIVQKAKSYIGQEELPQNSGFKNSWFQNLMAKVGWQKFQSWCAYFAMDVWIEVFTVVQPDTVPLIKKYANGSSLQTYINFQKSKEFHVQQNPVPGAIVIFRHGNSSTLGHEGIVTTVDGDCGGFNFTSGNTSAAGSREGTIVADKHQKLNLPFNPNGLNILGFVNPIRIA